MAATEEIPPQRAVKTLRLRCRSCLCLKPERDFISPASKNPRRTCCVCLNRKSRSDAQRRMAEQSVRVLTTHPTTAAPPKRSHPNQRGGDFTPMSVLEHCPHAMDELPAYFAKLPPRSVYRHGNLCIIETMTRSKFTVADYIRASQAWHCMGQYPCTREKVLKETPTQLRAKARETTQAQSARVGQPEHLLLWAMRERPQDPLGLIGEMAKGFMISLEF